MLFPAVSEHKCFSYPIHLTIHNIFEGSVLINEPGVLRCEIRKIGKDPAFQKFEYRQNYAGRIPGSDDLALEAEIELVSELHPSWRSLRIGIPLSMVRGITDFTVKYTGAYFSLYAGETLLDEEFPFGEPPGTPSRPWPHEVRKISDPVWKKIALHTWSPEGLNEWAGDISLGVFGDEFHLFYLLDRRHHGSKFCCGAHQWGHLVTKDFREWRDDGCIIPFMEQWQTYGTGTPFLLDGKITLAYGLHTERTFGPGKPPCGATFASSDDGIHFTPTQFSYDDLPENPSVYNMPDGSFIMYAGYGENALRLMRAEKWPDFHSADGTVALSGDDSPMHNNLDCPALFEWHGKYYLLVGFTAMFSGDDPSFANGIDLAAQGMDIYDGLNVPMVAAVEPDRRILVGWLDCNGWGGVLGIRELVWFDDGIPGIRWMDEAMPAVREIQTCEGFSGFSGEAFFEFMQSAGDDLLVQFNGTKMIDFSVNTSERRSGLAYSGQETVPTLRENPVRPLQIQAVEQIRNLGKPYKVRIMIREERKWNGCIIDAEIAGCRTIIRYFKECHLDQCRVLKGNQSYKQGKIGK